MRISVKNKQVDEAIAIMKEVAHWGRKNGLRVWLDEWLTREELLTEEATEDTFCVGYHNEKPAFSVIVQWQDKEWWPTADLNEAAYIHKLCVRREFAGMNMPRHCLDYIVDECKKRGARYIRLDTAWDEEKMREIYTSLGFRVVDKLTLKNGKFMALYEYDIKEHDMAKKRYPVVTLCGSTKFKEDFIQAQKTLTLAGNIVISVGMFGHSGDEEVWTEGTKEMLDDMHKRKIDMADEIYVINKNGYIGSSTRSEIAYAKENGKIIKYLEANK